MKKISLFTAICAIGAMFSGCSSYSCLNNNGPVASFEVVNQSYKLLGVVPLSTGTTWKSGPFTKFAGGMDCFKDQCSLDDNLASVRHACKVVGSDKVRNLTARVDDYSAWSLFLVHKRVIKTSCEIVK